MNKVVELLSYYNSYSYIWIKYYNKLECVKKETACRITTIQTMGNDCFMHHTIRTFPCRAIRPLDQVEQEEMLQLEPCKVGILNVFLVMVRLEILSLRFVKMFTSLFPKIIAMRHLQMVF